MTGFSDPDNPDDADPADEPAVAPMAPDEPGLPNQDDADSPRPMGGDDDIISGQYGPTADFGEG